MSNLLGISKIPNMELWKYEIPNMELWKYVERTDILLIIERSIGGRTGCINDPDPLSGVINY